MKNKNTVTKIILAIVIIAIGYSCYEIFVTENWKFNQEDQQKLIELEATKKQLEDDLEVLRQRNDSLEKKSNEHYSKWVRTRSDYTNLKRKFDEERNRLNSLTMDEQVRILSEWLNSKKE